MDTIVIQLVLLMLSILGFLIRNFIRNFGFIMRFVVFLYIENSLNWGGP